ncbi:glycosyltransferase family 39 protein [Candidatus Woesearchaeota archaeon]|nr:glycosyltransferase family 39 protein [Candidatus Woesearchaeota archaeon]MBL7050837.1 glycosyltransferase family 39 protein [Candidatus Woesearchaeota archaeon]
MKQPLNFIKKIKENYILITIFFIFILIKIVTATKVHQIIWDEAVYIGMGKFLFSFGKAGLWESIRPLGLPILLGAIWKLKLNMIIFAEILAVLFSLGNIFLVYLITKETFNKTTATIASFMLSITPLFFLYSSYILTGITSTFFALLAIYIYISKENLPLVGFFTALTFLFRFPQGLLLVAILFSIFINEIITRHSIKNTLKKLKVSVKKSYYPFILSFSLTILPFLIFNFLIYRKYTSKVYHAIFRPFILGFSHQANPLHAINSIISNISHYCSILIEQNWLIIFIFLAIFFFIKNKEYKNHKTTTIFIILTIYWLYFTLIINKQPRFSLAFLPYLVILSAYGIYQFTQLIKKQKYYIKYPIYTILLIFTVFSISNSVNQINEEFEWRVSYEFPITTEFQKYFQNNPIQGPILTTDPVLSTYTDNKYVPYYFSVNEGIQIYIQNRLKANAVIYSPSSFVCYDEDCEKKQQDLFTDIQNRFTKVFEEQYNNKTYYIFTTDK